MEKAYKYLVEGVQQKKIDRQVAIDLIKLLEHEDQRDDGDIAIIGMAAKLPSVDDLQEYWEIIESGVDCITDFPPSRSYDISRYLAFKGLPEEEIRYNKSAYLYEIDKFDYKFFKLSPKEASLMDPCQRIFLETSWQAIEDAGYGGNKLQGTNTGVYVGYASNLRDMYAKLIEDTDASALSIGLVGNLTAVIPSRISYLLDLKGASMVVDTACSSSLVAIDLACQAIRNKGCELAIAGGININTVPLNKAYMQTGIESSDGISRTFDEHAEGSGVGEGVGALVLKPLSKALKDKDHVYAVIKGSATNQDGKAAGITAPNPQAQRDVILKAWENAGIDPESIAYIETHGTGTSLGDPIEIQGIQSAFRKHTTKNQFCAVSSVKTNIGHSSEAAGIVSVFKAIMALRTKQLPPSIHFNVPNRSIAFEESPVYVNTKLRPWPAGDQPRRCGVSAFGISGTNCHLILEEAPDLDDVRAEGKCPGLFAISAKSQEALHILVHEYAAYLASNKLCSLDELCYTANTGRGHYSHRLAILAESAEDLASKLATVSFDENGPYYYGYHRVVDSKKERLGLGDLPLREQELLSAEVATYMINYRSDLSREHLAHICELYIKGAEIDWEFLYGAEKPKKLPLPVYPFERSKCWVDVPEKGYVGEQETKSDLFYAINWISEPMKENTRLVRVDEVLVIKEGNSPVYVDELIAKLQAQGKRVIEVTIGSAYVRMKNDSYTISLTEADYNQLFAEMSKRNITHIVHICGLSNRSGISSLTELESSQSTGVFSLFHLTRAILKNEINTKMHLLLLVSNLNAVTGEEEWIRPEYAPLVGLGKVVSQEYTHLVCKAIDVDDHVSVDNIVVEMERFTDQYQVSYRNGLRYVEEFGPINPDQYTPMDITIKDTGVYIITGGTGGIGLETAKYVASKNNATILLISRRFPMRSEWESILKSGTEQEWIVKIQTIQQIESMGSTIIVANADVSDMKTMESILNGIRGQFGRINGVFHGAGIAGAGYLFNKDIGVFESVIHAKVTGTWIIDKLTQIDKLDFFVMHSSGVALVGEAGQGDYVAGNAYMDAFAAYRRKNNHHALAVNWVSWKEAGMSVKFGINVDSFYKAIATDYAIQGLDTVLNRNISNVLIGEINESPDYLSLFHALPFNLTAELWEHINRLMNGKVNNIENAVVSNGNFDSAMINKGKLIVLPKGKHATGVVKPAHVTLKGKGEEDYNKTEHDIAKIFSEILGYPEIDIHDSLFELGGDSLLLMRIHKLVDEKYADVVSVTDMFEYPSVHKLASFINNRDEPIEEMLPVKDIRQEARDIFEKLATGSLSLEDALSDIEGL
ncbi:type I polyketide synthase [Paenibacillus sp. L3-i20]|uniref:type I polyketide synthase n=1 Tax=Paenibacillus sp. L3-i20 TaxID=2905833 RepID=UPI001EDDF729|nr:type I polyketide synthase [Paenibacillus sp. L3-i20]GKU80242.1 hypothetical protein L3i20_v246390 [Paenibacillus sp. L3-i20]